MAVWTLVIVFVAIVSLTRGQSLKESIFHKDSICDLDARISGGCTMEISRPSLMSCVSECGRQASCIGASLEKDTGKCFLHDVCSLVPVCKTADPNHDYYVRDNSSVSPRGRPSYCVHGQWDIGISSCVCDLGTFGDRCDEAHRRCHDVPDESMGVDTYGGHHTVYLDPLGDGNLSKVRCSLCGIQLMRNDGSMSFNRTWDEYVNGFGTPDFSNHWLGLEAWHVLTQPTDCRDMYVELNFGDPDAIAYKHLYEFVVGNRDEYFSFTFQGSSEYMDGIPSASVRSTSNSDDCMKNVEYLPFSTWDKNNGEDVNTNCASRDGYGWWHAQGCDNYCNYMGDWNHETGHQRFSMLGVDTQSLGPQINYVEMWLNTSTCSHH